MVDALLHFDMTKVTGPDSQSRIFDLKSLGFLLTLLKVFLISAFSANSEIDFALAM